MENKQKIVNDMANRMNRESENLS